MATLAENFLADLDDLSEGEKEQQQGEGGVDEAEENGDGDDKVEIVSSSVLSLPVLFRLPPGERVDRCVFFPQTSL